MQRYLIGLILLFCLAWPGTSEAARLFTCGFEENNLISTMWASTFGTAPTIGAVSPHSGTYRLNTSAAAVVSGARHTLSTTVNSGTQYTRFYFMADDATPSAQTFIYVAVSSSAVGGPGIELKTTGELILNNLVTTTTATTTATLSNNTWYRIEVRHLLSDTVGEIEMRLYNTTDGGLIETISITNEDTLPVNIQSIQFEKTDSLSTFSFDDIAWNDTSGSSQTAWPGPGKVYLLVPNADTSVTWENEAAGAATFTKIDDLPGAPDDATTYNTEIVNLNSTDRFGLTSLGAEVPSNATIVLVAVYARVGSTQTSTTQMNMKLWDDGGTLTTGPTLNVNVNGWIKLVNSTYLYFDAAGKTKTNIDSFDIGYENVTDVATRERRVTALWAEVEWNEASGARRAFMLMGVGE